MLNISDRFLSANVSNSREPALVIEVQNENGNIYFTTSKRIKITDAGSHRFDECIISATGGSQKIIPERGQSTVGDYTFSVIDNGLTDFQRVLLSSFNDTLNNNKVIFHYGFMNIRFDDYVSLPPQFINEINQDVNKYTFKTSDTQRFIRQKIFGSKPKTELVKGIGFSDATPLSTQEIEVQDNSLFSSVFHDDNWSDAKNREVGYLVASGTDSNGEDALEVIRWSGKVGSNKFVIDGRALFGTRQIDLAGSQDGGSIELEEFIYLDLNIPKMILAIMNGSLYGDAGKRLPDNWNASVSSAFINTPSFEEIGGDLWGFNLQFIGLDEDSAKEFLYEQCLKPFNLFMYIDQDGQLFLKRFSDIPYDAPAELTISNDSILSSPEILRNSKAIRNVFRVNWSWDWKEEKYARENGYIDADSFARNNIWSETLDINIKGIRNRDVDSQAIISSLAEGIRSRYSEPQIKPTVSVLMSSAIMLEVGSIIKLDLPNQPDFISDKNLNMSFEVQGISWNFLDGTMDLDLFGSSGQATPIDFDLGSDSVDVDYGAMGWTAIETVVSGTPTPDGNTFVIDQDQTIGSRDAITLLHNSFGDIKISDNITLTVLGTVWFGCKNFTIVNTGKIDAKSGGVIGGKGYFGGENSSQEGLKTSIKWKGFGPFKIPDRYAVRQIPGEGRGVVEASNLVVEKFSFPELNSDGTISKLPTTTKLFGNGGGAGGGLRNSAGLNQGLYAGGDAVAGGAGVAFCVNNLFFDNAECIDVSGSDNDPLGSVLSIAGTRYLAGVGGFGWPGTVLCFITDITSPRPNLYGVGGAVKARAGDWSERDYINKRPRIDGQRSYETKSGDNYAPRLPEGRTASGEDYSKKCSESFYVKKGSAFSPVAGKDIIENTGSPVININQKINFPESPKGNNITLELTATPVDNKFGFAFFDYKLKGQSAWYPARYGLTNESTIKVTALGDTYEIRARAYNSQGTAGGISVVEHTVPYINTDPETSVGGGVDVEAPIEIQVPTVKGLELVNRIDNNENWNQWKSPNAEFKWKRSAILNAGSIVSMNGVEDLHLKGYSVRIRRSKTGEILREEEIKENLYTYTFDKNKKDTGGNPVRQFYIEVQAVASTGHSSTWSGFEVANPAPASVTGIVTEQVKDGIFITYTPPSDIDFVGVMIRGDLYTGSSITIPPSTSRSEILEIISVDQFGIGESISTTVSNPAPSAPSGILSEVGFNSIKLSFVVDDDFDYIGTNIAYRKTSGSYSTDVLVSGNETVINNLDQGTEYEVRLTGVDSLGAGSSTSVIVTTNQLVASDVDDLSNWAVTTDPVDKAFILANMDNDAIPSTQIEGIATGKLEAGYVAVDQWIGVGSPTQGVIIDANTATVYSNNSGYEVTLGAHIDADIDPVNPLILSAYNGVDYNMWINSNGDFSLGNGGITYDASADKTIFSGELDAATGTFSGDLSAAGGTFSGELSAATGSFSGSVTIGAGSTGYSNMTDKPTNLSSINSGEGSKLSGIEANAQANATNAIWSRNYVVSASNKLPLKMRDGTTDLATRPLGTTNNTAKYLVKILTTGTGTVTDYSALVEFNGSTFDITVLNTLGTSSNHPRLESSGTQVIVSTYHANNYTLAVTVTDMRLVTDADNTQTAIEAGTTVGAGYIHLNGTDANIAIGASSAWKSEGIQLQYNSGNPRFNIGPSDEDKKITFENSELTIGEKVSVIGVDGYENNGQMYHHFYGHQLIGALSRNLSFGTISFSAEYGRTKVFINDTSNISKSYYQINDGGNKIDFTKDFSWKVHLGLSSMGVSDFNFFRIGASSQGIDSTASNNQAVLFSLVRSGVGDASILASYRVNGSETTHFSGKTVSGFVTLEVIYKNGLLTSKLTESSGTVTTYFNDASVTFGTGDMRNALEVQGKPYSPDADIELNIYDFRVKGIRST